MMKQLLGVIASAGTGGGGPGPGSDFPVIESYNTNTDPATNAGFITVTKPASVAIGDLLLFIVGDADTTATDNWTAPSGFFDAGHFGNATSDSHFSIFWRIADGTETATATANVSDTGDDIGAIYIRISNADQTAPISMVGAETTTAGLTVVASDITTPTDNNLVIALAAKDANQPTGWSFDNGFSSLHSFWFDADPSSGLFIGESDEATAGAIGATTLTIDDNSDGLVAMQFSIQPPQPTVEALIKIPAHTVGSDLTDFPIMIDLADMSAAFIAAVDASGDNIRAYEVDGTTVIPHDVTYFNKPDSRGRMYVKKTITEASDTEFLIKAETTGTARLAVGDTNGRNAVWSDYEVVWQFPETDNRTGNAYTQDVVDLEPHTEWITVDYHEFVGNPHQGLAVDGSNLITIDTNYFRRHTTSDFVTVAASNIDPVGDVNTDKGITALDHASDGCIVSGELWVPIGKYPPSGAHNEWLAVFDSTTLAYLRAYDVTSGTILNSSICYDGTSLFYCCDFDDGTVMRTYNSTGVLQSTITLSTSVSSAQGIEYVDGVIYIACSDANEATYAFETDGTYIGEVFRRPTVGIQEGLSYDGTSLWSLDGDGDLIRLQQVAGITDYRKLHYANINVNIPTLSTTWTMATSVYWSVEGGDLQHAFLSIGDGVTDANRASLAYDDGPDVISMWNSTDSWVAGSYNPGEYDTFRVAAMSDGTTNRKVWENGAATVDSPVSARPVSAGTDADFVVNASRTDNWEDGEGYYQNIWLRHEAMSDDWMFADHANMHDRANFYVVNDKYTDWRVLVDEGGHENYLSIQEIEMAAAASGTNLCTNGYAYAGTNRTGWGPEEAFDGDKVSTSHGWSVDKTVDTDRSEWWVAYSFTNPQDINELRLFARPDWGVHMPVSFRLQYLDGTVWKTKFSARYEPFWDDSETRAFTANVDHRTEGAARYWRVWGPTSDNGTNVHIAELEFRESHGGADVTTTGFAIQGGERVGFEGTYAFDNIATTSNSWGVATGTTSYDLRWIGQDFGAANDKDVVEIQMTSRADSFYSQTPTSFYIERSTDGVTYTPAWYVESMGATWTAADSRIYRSPWAADELRLIGENGTAGAQDTTDQSPAATTLTWGGGSEVSETQALHGQTKSIGINHDDLSGDTLTIPAIDFGSTSTDDFTVEVWFFSTTHNATYFHALMGNGDNSTAGSWSLFVRDDPNNYLDFRCQGGAVLLGATDIAEDEWHHAAICREGDDWYLYLDGVQQDTHTDAARSMYGAAAGAIHIGGNQAGVNDEWRGFLDKVRITKGFCRYPGGTTFNPPEYVG